MYILDEIVSSHSSTLVPFADALYLQDAALDLSHSTSTLAYPSGMH